MKTSSDPRHKRRQRIVQELFKTDFHRQRVGKDTSLMLKENQVLDEYIKLAAPEFPIDKINKIDLAILRLAIYELVIEKKEPTNAIIDEAIELAKEFSGETSPAFINGALGNIIRHEKTTTV
jgi:transcription antitermination protein NusB